MKKALLDNEDELELNSFNDDADSQHLLSVADELEPEDEVEDPEFENEDKLLVFDAGAQARRVVAILKPVAFTMALVVFLVRVIHTQNITINIGMVYHESGADSSGMKFAGSILNALVFVGIVTGTTLLFVLLYKFRCMKILYGWLIMSTSLTFFFFGGLLAYLAASASNVAVDWISFSILLWNFGVVGILAVFWRAPPIVNQAYLVAVSALMAIFFSFAPEWTTWALLVAISLYDLAAVLLPFGPLRMLVEAAQQRQEHIPALLYSGLVTLMANDDSARDGDVQHHEGEEEEEEQVDDGVKLGLGDFVFYSVLLGRAALFDMLTVFTCFVAILTGLFGTLILLSIFQQALPALPFSIALAMLFFFLTRFFLLPFVLFLGVGNVLV